MKFFVIAISFFLLISCNNSKKNCSGIPVARSEKEIKKIKKKSGKDKGLFGSKTNNLFGYKEDKSRSKKKNKKVNK